MHFRRFDPGDCTQLSESIYSCVTSRSASGQPMSAIRPDDPILVRFRRALDKVYGDKIARVVLFGSRARGDAHPGSDYDIAVFLNGQNSFNEEAARLAAIETDILYDTGAVINAMPFQAGAYQHRTALMYELRRDGVEL
jgi:uncharacterized protein